MKKFNLISKIALICAFVFFSLSIILGVALLVLRAPSGKYYDHSFPAFVIPGLSDGLVQQGFHYDEKNDIFFVSGYMCDKSSSRIYLLDGEDYSIIKFVTLKKQNGTAYKGHAGGVAVYKDFLYIAGGEDGCLFVFSLDDILSSKKSVTALGTFSLATSENDYLGASFVTVSGNRLITGEFYRAGNYPTPDSHKFFTPNGDYNQAVALEYSLDDDFPFAINPEPKKAYSLPNQIQGLALNNGKIFLSASWGLSQSTLYEYDEKNLTENGSLSLLGYNSPLYHLDSGVLTAKYTLPPMAEEIVFKDGSLFVMNESASKKYIFGLLTGGNWCYQTDLNKMR